MVGLLFFDRIIFTVPLKVITKNIFHHIKNNGIIVAPIIEKIQSSFKKIYKEKSDENSRRNFIPDVIFVPILNGTKII